MQGRAPGLRGLPRRAPREPAAVPEVRARRWLRRAEHGGGLRPFVGEGGVPARRLWALRHLPQARRSPERVSARALQMPRARLRLRRLAADALPPHQHRASHARAQDPVRQGAPAASATVGATALAVRGGGPPRVFLGRRHARHRRAYRRVGRLHQSGGVPTAALCGQAMGKRTPGEPKGRTDAVKVEMEVTSSKDPGDVDVQELTFLTVPPKLLAGAKLVSLHIQIDKLTS